MARKCVSLALEAVVAAFAAGRVVASSSAPLVQRIRTVMPIQRLGKPAGRCTSAATARDLPACATWHGPTDQGIAAVRAQHWGHGIARLRSQADGPRYSGRGPGKTTPNRGIMFTIAKRPPFAHMQPMTSYVLGLR